MLKILGDINLTDGYFHHGYGVGSLICKGQNPFKFLSRNPNDFWIGNLEFVIANTKERFNPFVVSPDCLKNINHLNLYGIANNHVLQKGSDSYQKTITYLQDNDILFAGSKNQKTVKFKHQNKLIGFLAFSQRPDNFSNSPIYWHLPEYKDILENINNLKDCDFRIAFLHWGYEFINYPNIEQKQLAHFLIDEGIDLVIGMHPHIAQGYEIYNGKYIFYSLGNAVFNMNWEPTKYGLLVNVNFEVSNPKISVDYLRLDHKGFPHVVKNVPYIYNLNHLNSLISINEENEKYFDKVRQFTSKYRRINRRRILIDIFKGKNKKAIFTIKDFLKRKFEQK